MPDAIVIQLIEKRNKEKLSVPKLAKALDIPADRIYKWEQGHGNPKGDDIDKLRKWLEEVPKLNGSALVEDEKPAMIDLNQPVIQVILNLSYTGRKNADSMDKMAATNQKNTEIIAALVGTILGNSYLSQPATSAPGGSSSDDEELASIEELVGKEGMKILKAQFFGGKKKAAGK